MFNMPKKAIQMLLLCSTSWVLPTETLLILSIFIVDKNYRKLDTTIKPQL